MLRRDFIKKCISTSALGTFASASSPSAAGTLLAAGGADIRLKTKSPGTIPQLDKVGENFTFALFADPQLSGETTIGTVGGTSAVRYTESIKEINAMAQKPAFSIIDGDLVNVPTHTPSWDNFMSRTLEMDCLPILVYGNHDGNAQTNHYEIFQEHQQTCCGIRDYYFSFDCGKWHFVVLPCDIVNRTEELEILAWLKSDLHKNRNRPTMLFLHEHLMPQGLTQLEWYTYNRTLRMEILDEIARWGNVKYAVWGHVHNGIQASVKTAWTYRGINFITAPTCTASRPFGEEFDDFEPGEDQGDGDTGGGYYMIFEVSGEDVVVKARVANVDREYTYSPKFREYTSQEPLWFCNIHAYPPKPALVNGSFENGLDGWMMPYRYQGDTDPMFKWEVKSNIAKSGGKALLFRVHEAGQPWAQTEMLEAYQMVDAPVSPVLKFSYRLDSEPVGGGGYVKVCAYSGETLQRLMLLDWGATDNEKSQSVNMVRNTFYTADDRRPPKTELINWGNQKKAMFWSLPDTLNKWHDLTLNIKDMHDTLRGSGSWEALGITKILITVGVWTLENDGSENSCIFDDVSLTSAAGETSNINGVPLASGSTVYNTAFGSA
ncbi:cyclic 3',5'-adenosine monophosphate phosphodiesterase [Limihaloglobus sulfuriphilus]|uniref:Cyclic 3',5'-adenosine monophosphate phosphodiesterase n=1 Tax=Limihaloglobus sulfuriphilus TaxID=1851148 RepID=A0A1Q2MAY2_9BACT|nr:metallophosphoesterase [Limihaloglobus sulfuriphilus]AQQ69820.1 cyclic 3',5'-adenosine monophosphate phosphodiesterase [Limihaloglobus sulfuriphilus]